MAQDKEKAVEKNEESEASKVQADANELSESDMEEVAGGNSCRYSNQD